MVDFTNCVEEINSYKGKEKKKTLIYNGKRYLVKFPDPIIDKNRNIFYINNTISEYIGSNIFKIVGIDTQNTILGIYEYNGKKKIVCACEDFTDSNHILYEFENLVLSTNPDKKIDTELTDIIEVISNSENIIDNTLAKKRFWDMFIIDSLIGNTDRHNGNWGFLMDKNTKEVYNAPIYDCGSCLNPMYEDEEISNFSDTDIKNLALNCYSCIKEEGKRINYFSYIKSIVNKECNEAIVRVFNNINMSEINKFIDSIECMSDVRKKFYKRLIELRYEVIKEVYEKLI